MDRSILDRVRALGDDRWRLFLEGPAGTGKTSLGVQRLLHLLRNGVPAESILVWVPQRVLGQPYREPLWQLHAAAGAVTVATVGGLARRTIALFWPLIAERAGFSSPAEEPIFLTLETTQYYMHRIVTPFVEAGYFDGLAIRRNRLSSQIIDNLNKAATVGFPHTEVASRLKGAWGGERAQKRVYDQGQECANAFRAYCLAHNLLDFSLQVQVFFRYILAEPICREYLFGRYRHLIVDNIEEETPRGHDLLKQWLAKCASALIMMDQAGGYRVFLGADPQGAAEFKWLCQDWITLEHSYVMSPQIEALGGHLAQSIGGEVSHTFWPPKRFAAQASNDESIAALCFEPKQFQPQMLEWVADQVAELVHEQGVPPGEIVILAPFLGDALRFTLSNALALRDVPVRSHRPSRALREEPEARCLLTLAAIAHPRWEHCPARLDVANALVSAIDGLDPVRARLLTEIVYRSREGCPSLSSFDQIEQEMQGRISFTLGERFDLLRRWLSEYATAPSLALDDFVGRIFTEVLSLAGFGFYRNLGAGQVAANLIESIQKFRRVVGHTLTAQDAGGEGSFDLLNLEYVRMVERGVIAATYVSSWQVDVTGAVLMAPAYTFLMADRPVDVQFWIDVGGSGWWERLYQPLTHPYVLSRHWEEGNVWTDADEFSARQVALGRLVLGLVRRCRRQIYLGIANLGEQGYEQRGPLLQVVQRTLRRTSTPSPMQSEA